MAKSKGKSETKGKTREKKLSVKKQPIKDLEVSKEKEVKGGMARVRRL